MTKIKEIMCIIFGVFGTWLASALGGWDSSLITLIIFMITDYVTGLVVATVFKKSTKSENGGFSSAVGWKGIIRKFVILLVVLLAHRLDLELQVEYIRTAVIVAFMANELISITENIGLMGVPLPKVITKAISILQDKAESEV